MMHICTPTAALVVANVVLGTTLLPAQIFDTDEASIDPLAVGHTTERGTLQMGDSGARLAAYAACVLEGRTKPPSRSGQVAQTSMQTWSTGHRSVAEHAAATRCGGPAPLHCLESGVVAENPALSSLGAASIVWSSPGRPDE
jgi:acetyl-CoA acetyltransferase